MADRNGLLGRGILSLVVLILITATVFAAGCNGDGDGDGDGDVADSVKDDVESYLGDFGIDDTDTYTEQGGTVVEYDLDEDMSTSEFDDMVEGLIDEGYEEAWTFEFGGTRGVFLNTTVDDETVVVFIYMIDSDPDKVFLVVGADDWWDDYDGGDGGDGEDYDDVEDKEITDEISSAVNDDLKPILAELCDGAKVYFYFSSSGGYYDFDYIVNENMTVQRFNQMVTDMEDLEYEEFTRYSSDGGEFVDFDHTLDGTNMSVFVSCDIEDDADIVTVSIIVYEEDDGDDGGDEGDYFEDTDEVEPSGALGTELNDLFYGILEDRASDVKLAFFMSSSIYTGDTVTLTYVTMDEMSGSTFDDIIDDMEDEGWDKDLDISGDGAYTTHMSKEIDGDEVVLYIYFSEDSPQDLDVIASSGG